MIGLNDIFNDKYLLQRYNLLIRIACVEYVIEALFLFYLRWGRNEQGTEY